LQTGAVNFGISVFVAMLLGSCAIAGLIAVMPKNTGVRFWSDPIHVLP
jgi:hypothetical protein